MRKSLRTHAAPIAALNRFTRRTGGVEEAETSEYQGKLKVKKRTKKGTNEF